MVRSTSLILTAFILILNQDGEVYAIGAQKDLTQPRSRLGESNLLVQPFERQDISQRLSPLFCENKDTNPLAIWSKSIFDAQIEGRYLETESLPADKLLAAAKTKAKSLALMNGLSGYAYGKCENQKKAWAAAMPAPSPLLEDKLHKNLILPLISLKKNCSSWRADYAKTSGALSKQLNIDDRGQIRVGRLERGLVSITCQPKMPQWAGPVLWYLYAVGGEPDTIPPESDALDSDSIVSALLTWVQKIRSREGLNPLTSTQLLDQYAEFLAVDGSVRHNKSQQSFVAMRLQESNFIPIGEDRVRGQNAARMAWLLWNSPRHRDLLLNPDADLIGIGLSRLSGESLAVILTGKAYPGPIARLGSKASHRVWQ